MAASGKRNEPISLPDLVISLYERLADHGAGVTCTFENMEIEVPRDAGVDAPRARWRVNGTLKISTTEKSS